MSARRVRPAHRLAAVLGACAVALTACSSDELSPTADGSGAAATTSTPHSATTSAGASAGAPTAGTAAGGTAGVTGQAPDPSAGDGVDVATDPPAPAPNSGSGGSAPRAVDVTVTYSGYDASASAVVAGGVVLGVVEDTGTCSLVLTRGGQRATASASAAPDVSSTACGDLRVDRAQLAPGSWDLVLTYSSPTSTGTSPVQEVEIP
ncbi:hypothetical protein [Klenkia brasiliensis]|uniref:Uncharacterized protein n=1 Tax=Klenkia brasiliensis TaxID=333142 RepID=A0A1G8AG78_9ACTN|nr:hypothetical protein [Klenkia brasiliensis]SDH19972.1 hypothetical protein SAMN05660324_0134 [Klenkia brasiliensis]